MMKSAILILLTITSCNMSDGTKQLGDGYWLNIEGRGVNRIFGRGTKGIQHDVLLYDYSDDYIVAKQKPDTIIDAIDDDDIIDYPEGRGKIYYWIIIKEIHKRIGPLNEAQFKEELEKNNLPSTIEWRTIYGN
ncbi:MAG: hypothetical protein ACO1N9_09865 [Flavobacterium sp.]